MSRNITVDAGLKWAAWCSSVSSFEDLAEDMQAAFDGEEGSMTIRTAPRKSCEYGSVTISEGKAEGTFTVCWDEVSDLADTFGLLGEDGEYAWPVGCVDGRGSEPGWWSADEQMQCFADSLPFSVRSLEPGGDRTFAGDTALTASTLDELMEKIQGELDALHSELESEWSLLELMYRSSDPED